MLQISWEPLVEGPRHVEHYELYAMPAGDTVIAASNQDTYFPTMYSYLGGLFINAQWVNGVSGAMHPHGARSMVFEAADATVSFGGSLITANSGGWPDTAVAAQLHGGGLLWSHHYGDALNGGYAAQLFDSEFDKEGNLFLAGAIQRTVDLGSGPVTKSGAGLDVLVMKLDVAGNLQWSTRLGDDSIGADQAAIDIDVDSAGNALVLGTFGGTFDPGGGPITAVGPNDAFLVKLTPDGSFDWQLHLPGGANGFDLDGADNIVITGVGPTDFGSGPVGPDYLAKLNSAGSLVWSQTFGFPIKADVDFEGYIAVMSLGTSSLPANADFGAGPILPPGVSLQMPSTSCAGIGLAGAALFNPDGSHRWSHGIIYTGGNQYQGLQLESYDVAAARHGGLDVSFGAAGNFYVDVAVPSCPSLGVATTKWWRSAHFSFAQ